MLNLTELRRKLDEPSIERGFRYKIDDESARQLLDIAEAAKRRVDYKSEFNRRVTATSKLRMLLAEVEIGDEQ